MNRNRICFNCWKNLRNVKLYYYYKPIRCEKEENIRSGPDIWPQASGRKILCGQLLKIKKVHLSFTL